MIYTITFNPSIDYIVNIDNFELDKVNRVEMDTKYPGGKGINVSRVLNNLGIESCALGYVGNFTGEYIKKYIENEGVKTDFIYVSEDTRINVKIKSGKETEINGLGPVISDSQLEELFLKADKFIENDIVVLAGNVQKSVDYKIYSRIQERLKDKKINFVIDTTGEALRCTLRYRPFLIKPNKSELGELFKAEINTTAEIVFYARKLIELGAQNVIVSNGGEGAVLVSSEGVFSASAPKGKVKNSVGAGDSMVAGFLAYYSKYKVIPEAFRYAAAAGSATAFSLDLCKKDDVNVLLEKISLNKLS